MTGEISYFASNEVFVENILSSYHANVLNRPNKRLLTHLKNIFKRIEHNFSELYW